MKTKSVITEKGILMSKLAQKYVDIIESGTIQENEIISFRSFLANKATKEERNELTSMLADNPLNISKEQSDKGLAFLMNQWKTPRGKTRYNNPFGYRETQILENFVSFKLYGFYDNSRYNSHPFYLPIYQVNGSDTSFEYYYNGEMNIIG